MTREEYLTKTQIKSVEEARSRLTHLRILFAVVFVYFVLLNGGASLIDQDTYSLIWAGYLGLLIYFVVYCVKVIKLTKDVTQANAFWSIIFAPISWFWFYPEIAKPLKIILGEIEPPEKLTNRNIISEETKKAREASNKRYWKIVTIAAVSFFALIGIAIAFIVIDSQTNQSVTSNGVTTPAVQTQQKELGYHYVSSDSGFEADFPESPSRQEHTTKLDDGSSMTYVMYQASKNDSLYYVSYYSYSNPAVDENSPNYNLKSDLESSMNAMAHGITGSKIVSSNFTSFLGHQAITFTLNADPKSIEGLIFLNGVHLYGLFVEYPSTSLTKPSFEDFKAGFRLSNSVSVQTPYAEQPQPNFKKVDSGNYNQNKITASVVNILCPSSNDGSGGSGTLLDSSGLIMTNNHIIPEDNNGDPLVKSCLVTLPDSQGKVKEIYYGKPIIIPDLSQTYDLAFLQLSAAFVDDAGTSYGNFPNTFPAFFPDGCENSNPTLGEKIRVFGYPAISGGGYYLTLTDGVVSSLPNDGTIVTSAKIDHGSSGGLAVDEQGCMVGIPSMISGDKNESLGVLISDSVVGEFMTKLQEVIKQSGQ